MNPDDFEKRLQRQPLRQIPPEWRKKILQSATPPRSSTLASRLSTLFWPHPKAWAGLAAAWLVIMALQLASSERMDRFAKKAEPSPIEALIVLQQQHQLLAELFGPSLPKDADRPKPNPLQPRSERRNELLVA